MKAMCKYVKAANELQEGEKGEGLSALHPADGGKEGAECRGKEQEE